MIGMLRSRAPPAAIWEGAATAATTREAASGAPISFPRIIVCGVALSTGVDQGGRVLCKIVPNPRHAGTQAHRHSLSLSPSQGEPNDGYEVAEQQGYAARVPRGRIAHVASTSKERKRVQCVKRGRADRA